MLSKLRYNTLISRIMVVSVAFIIILLSCTKSKNNPSKTTSVKYCSSIDWSSTQGESGTFTGALVNGNYNLVYTQHTENGNVGGFPLHYDANSHLISDQPGITYAYTQNYLANIHVDPQTGTGNGDYTFDSNGHLVHADINLTGPQETGTVNGNYTYDSNEDPTSFVASGTVQTPQGLQYINIQITGDFLLDKTSLLPFMPVFAPATSFFSFIPFNSKHLLNKWDITISGTGIQTITYTSQYTYTYDSNGNVSTMVRSDNPAITYTFVYSGCNM